MNLSKLVDHATDKERFHTVEDYIDFCSRYLEYVDTGLQARIVSQNERHYLFFQYKQDGNFNITRPLNSRLMYDAVGFAQQFRLTLEQLRDGQQPSSYLRENLIAPSIHFNNQLVPLWMACLLVNLIKREK
ncbi:hypothetical protein [Photorhabdus asymbiotica]|uniref:hypothetical protein n=1 Tax=Photorhabdus asymbiotica TaxID=291112 RepID=UPI003DA79678